VAASQGRVVPELKGLLLPHVPHVRPGHSVSALLLFPINTQRTRTHTATLRDMPDRDYRGSSLLRDSRRKSAFRRAFSSTMSRVLQCAYSVPFTY